MQVTVIIDLGKKYLTEEILAAFEKWGPKSSHSTTDAAGDIVGWYSHPKSGTVRLGNKGSRHGSLENSLHLGRKFSKITLMVKVDDNAKFGANIQKQYFQLLRKKNMVQRRLANIGSFIKKKLASKEPTPS